MARWRKRELKGVVCGHGRVDEQRPDVSQAPTQTAPRRQITRQGWGYREKQEKQEVTASECFMHHGHAISATL
uniref:Uncharacterized protein n=1 Tax=Knipowitschia caucasica TaxID=637954 RepID=A0AAV2L9U8_KNICA